LTESPKGILYDVVACSSITETPTGSYHRVVNRFGDDDTPKMLGSAVRLSKQETRGFYVEKGFSLRRGVLEKLRGKR
ncbi:hypothetical protein ACLOJK_018696, partial [Asimina triloba]